MSYQGFHHPFSSLIRSPQTNSIRYKKPQAVGKPEVFFVSKAAKEPKNVDRTIYSSDSAGSF